MRSKFMSTPDGSTISNIDVDDLDGSAAHPGMVAYVEPVNHPECLSMLARCSVGRIGIVVDGQPVVLPVNYALDGDCVLFRTSESSVLNQAAGENVAFEVDRIDDANRSGWSVMVQGRAIDISDTIDATSRRLRRLQVISWAPGSRHNWFIIRPSAITGRRIRVIPAAL